MKKALFGLSLAGMMALLLAAGPTPPPPPDAYTTQDQTFYVAPGGNDRNTCTVSTGPCKTIQGAINKIPKHIRHRITVAVGAGTYYADEALTVITDAVTGSRYHRGTVQLNGFTLEDNAGDPNQRAWLHVECTQVEVLPSTYVVSGTYDGLATGTLTAPPDAGWVTDAYAGMFVEYLTGANHHTTDQTGAMGNLNLSTISSNTGTILSLTTGRGWASNPSAADTFHVVSNATHIVGKKATTGNSATDVLAAVAFVGNSGGEVHPYTGGTSSIELRNCDVVIPDAGTSTVGIYVENGTAVISGMTMNSRGVQMDLETGAYVGLWDSFMRTTSGAPQGVLVNGARLDAFDNFISGQGAVGINSNGYAYLAYNQLVSVSSVGTVTFDHSAGRLVYNVFRGNTASAGARLISSRVDGIGNAGSAGAYGYRLVWQSALSINADTLTGLVYSADGGTTYPDAGVPALSIDNGTTINAYGDVTGATNKTLTSSGNGNTVSSY